MLRGSARARALGSVAPELAGGAPSCCAASDRESGASSSAQIHTARRTAGTYGVVTVRVKTSPVEYVAGAPVIHERCIRRNSVLLHGSLRLFFRTWRDSTVESIVVIAFHITRSARRHSRSLSAFPGPRDPDDARIETLVVRAVDEPPVTAIVNAMPVGFWITPALKSATAGAGNTFGVWVSVRDTCAPSRSGAAATTGTTTQKALALARTAGDVERNLAGGDLGAAVGQEREREVLALGEAMQGQRDAPPGIGQHRELGDTVRRGDRIVGAPVLERAPHPQRHAARGVERDRDPFATRIATLHGHVLHLAFLGETGRENVDLNAEARHVRDLAARPRQRRARLDECDAPARARERIGAGDRETHRLPGAGGEPQAERKDLQGLGA